MRMTVLFFIALIGYGCAAKKMAVNNADTLLSYQVTKRLPLYSTQKDELGKDLEQFLNRSKPLAQEIIPVIDELTLEHVDQTATHYKKLEAFYRKIASDFSLIMSKYMAKLDNKQQKEFFKTAEEENSDILTKDKKERIEDNEERMEKFFGSVNTSQKQIIASYGDYFMENSKTRVERRKELQQQFKYIYDQDVSPKTKEELFHNAFLKYQDERAGSHKNIEILKKLVPTITKPQREHFRREAQEIKDIIKYFLQVNY